MIEFATFTDEEQKHVTAIVARALPLLRASGIRSVDRMSLTMDLSAVHAKVPLRLAELANADNGNFGHDVAGIIGHLNRQTGELDDCFLPRFAAPQPDGESLDEVRAAQAAL